METDGELSNGDDDNEEPKPEETEASTVNGTNRGLPVL